MELKDKIAGFIDHTLLRPDATENDIAKLCNEALKYDFYSVCIHPSFIKKSKEILSGSRVKISTVIGFPLGMAQPRVKIYEAMESALEGADELDIVINIGKAKTGDWDAVEKEAADLISATSETVHKIIIETCYLSDDEKKRASLAAVNAGAEFIKTSTGFGSAGAKIEDIALIREAAGGRAGIKASGGIKRLQEVLAFIEAGAARIGTSSGVEIMKETLER